jgi:hypothetical protein
MRLVTPQTTDPNGSQFGVRGAPPVMLLHPQVQNSGKKPGCWHSLLHHILPVNFTALQKAPEMGVFKSSDAKTVYQVVWNTYTFAV